jgi:tetratricopeptide (TPR) repeat protein
VTPDIRNLLCLRPRGEKRLRPLPILLIVVLAMAFSLPLQLPEGHAASGYLKPNVSDRTLNRAQSFFDDGVELYQRKSYRAALRKFLEAEKACPELFAAGYHVALTHRKMKNEEAAVAQLKKLISRFPENIIAYNDLGVIHAGKSTEADTLLAVSKFETAVKNGESLLQGKEKDIPQVRLDLSMAYANLAALQFKNSRFAESEKNFRKAIEHYPHAFFGHFGLGNVLLVMKRFTEAKAAYREAQRVEPDNVNVRIALAKCYLFEPDKNPRFALTELRKIKAEDRPLEYFELTGDAYALLENSDEAIKNYKASLARPGHSPEVLYKLGALYYNTSDFGQAQKYLETFVTQSPEEAQGSLPTAYKLLGDIARGQSDYEKAIAKYDKAAKLRDDYLSAHYGLAESYFHLQRYDEARKHLRLILERLPEKGTAEQDELREKATALLEKMVSAK